MEGALARPLCGVGRRVGTPDEWRAGAFLRSQASTNFQAAVVYLHTAVDKLTRPPSMELNLPVSMWEDRVLEEHD